jgi:hypothetical protein
MQAIIQERLDIIPMLVFPPEKNYLKRKGFVKLIEKALSLIITNYKLLVQI